MRSHTVIPDDHSSRSPLHASLEVLTLGDMVVQELEEEVTLLLLVADDPTSELRVDEDGLLAGHRVCADDRVNVGHGITAHDAAAGAAVGGLLDACGVV